MAQSISNDHKTLPPFTTYTTYVSQTHEAEIGENKQHTHYVPLQTREHAWAGMSGMLHYVGLEGHLRPEALNLEAWNHMLSFGQ